MVHSCSQVYSSVGRRASFPAQAVSLEALAPGSGRGYPSYSDGDLKSSRWPLLNTRIWLARSEEGTGFTGTGLTNGCKLLYGCLELNLGTLNC